MNRIVRSALTLLAPALLMVNCGPNIQEVRKVAREEAEKVYAEKEKEAEAAKLAQARVEAEKLAQSQAEARQADQFKACKSNLKNMGMAFEMYSCDYAGRYPPQLELLVPGYLSSVPVCPKGASYVSQTTAEPDLYTIVCTGNHEEFTKGVKGLPQYTSATGLLWLPEHIK